MLTNKTMLWIITLPFLLLTVYAVAEVGYIGIFEYHLPSPAGWQVFADLCIAAVLCLTWMWRDARENNRVFVPYLVLTLFLGSIGILCYLLLSPTASTVTDDARNFMRSQG